MTAPVSPPSYATVADYELRTGITVPDSDQATVQQRLDDYAALMALYMGPCEPSVAAAYPDILTSLDVAGVQRSFGVVPGIRSESVGSTSVSYVDLSADAIAGVFGPEREVLDALMAACCVDWNPSAGGQVGQIGVAYDREGEQPGDVWVVSRW
jgi:hypothetical protein